MSRRAHEIQAAGEIAAAAGRAGFRPFLAEKGNYGFYTDADGTRVVCFQVNGYLETGVSGNYVTSDPRKTGTGWCIADSFNADMIRDYFDARPPGWAVSTGITWRYATLDDHLNRYGASSKYIELTAE